MKAVLISLSLLSIGLVGCTKFSEGPSFSIQTRKARICNDWKLSDYVLNGNNVFDASITTKMSIDKDGTYSISNYTNVLEQIQGTYSHGTWVFGEDNTSVFFYADTTTVNPVHEYSIKELRSKRMVLEEEIFQTGDKHRLTFIQQ
ncbi:MAG: hypothetical protein FJ349_03240 [Sphingomonadales bacterium]|nr:hypothetical protein [Sphingomonadales bacterium]